MMNASTASSDMLNFLADFTADLMNIDCGIEIDEACALTGVTGLGMPKAQKSKMPSADSNWRTSNVGYALFSATDRFVAEKLRIVHEGDYEMVTDSLVTLFQNLDLDGTRLNTLSARASMTKQSMLELVDKATALGFVDRRPDPSDGRGKIVFFMPTGLRVLDQIRIGVLEAERRMSIVTGKQFLKNAKILLTQYISKGNLAGQIPTELEMKSNNSSWRTQSVGRVLTSATRLFVHDTLHTLRREEFELMPQVLLTLFRNLDLEGTRLATLSTRARMTKQAMKELVDTAEILGLIERLPDPEDGRAKLVSFTPLGRRMLDRLKYGVANAEKKMVAIVGSEFKQELTNRLLRYAKGREAFHLSNP